MLEYQRLRFTLLRIFLITLIIQTYTRHLTRSGNFINALVYSFMHHQSYQVVPGTYFYIYLPLRHRGGERSYPLPIWRPIPR